MKYFDNVLVGVLYFINVNRYFLKKKKFFSMFSACVGTSYCLDFIHSHIQKNNSEEQKHNVSVE